MKNKNLHIILAFAAFLTMSGCQSFKELEVNPNVPVSSPPNLVFNAILNSFTERPWGKETRWNQFYTINYNYYGNNEYDWTTSGTYFDALKNVTKMEEEAKKSTGKDLNPYAALGKFFKAYFFVWMTQRIGDLPMNEALKGTENTSPKYNTQKEIYVQALKWLDESNDDLTKLIAAGDISLQGDIYLSNNLRAWQKVVNTYKLRVLISLSKKESDAELNIKGKFAEVISNPTKYPIMAGMGDNLAYKYNSTYNKYPVNPDNFGFDATRQQMSTTNIDLLKATQDPRLFFIAEPAEAQIKKGLAQTDFAAFVGANPSESLDDMSTKALNGLYSYINRNRYYKNYSPENTIQIGYIEMCFNIAEAANRGWVTANAEDWYTKGIQASQSFFDIKNGENTVVLETRNGANATSAGYTVKFSWADFYAQAAVKYAGNNAKGLEQINNQKYLGFFMNSGMEAFYNWRRTGFPTNFAKGGPGTGNSGVIPRRWLYPNSERIYNETNYKAAVQSQFGKASESINDELWLLK